MKLSVIIPCYNAASTLGDQLEALARQAWSEPWEIIIANNRSTDNSLALVEQYRARLPNMRVVDASARQGQPYALNTGAAAARGVSLAFTDADDEIGLGWVAAMGAALAQHDFVACRIDDEKLNPPLTRRMRGNNQRDGLQPYRYPPYLPHAGGGTLGVKRVHFDAVGGFDEALPYLHDTDFCWKLQRMGVELHFVPNAVLHIRYRETLGSLYRQARNYGEYNVILYTRYRRLGMPALSWKQGVYGWMDVAQRLFHVRDRVSFGSWLWFFGWRLGRVRGSIKHRVVAL
jgi:glycosyltransferase involved in cell wall biosynthesis